MIGIAYARTPFGKANLTDSRNFWTIIFDSANFAGPIAYFLPEFWSLRGKGREKATINFKDFSTVPLIGMSSPAWECQAMQSYVDGGVLKLSRMSFSYRNGRTVLWMGQRAHDDSDIMDPLEKALSSGKSEASQLLGKGRAPSNCKGSERSASFGNAATWGTFSDTMESDDCVWSAKVANTSCPRNGMCDLPQFFKSMKPVNPSEASVALRKQRFPTEENPNAAYDALATTPKGVAWTRLDLLITLCIVPKQQMTHGWATVGTALWTSQVCSKPSSQTLSGRSCRNGWKPCTRWCRLL